MNEQNLHAQAVWDTARIARADRAKAMPSADAALTVMFTAHLRLKELGWRDPSYMPRGGKMFQAVSLCSTGIHEVWCDEQGHCWAPDAGDLWPYNVFLWHPLKRKDL